MLPQPRGGPQRDPDRGSYGAPDLSGFRVVTTIEPGDAIYAGMIVGENARENDIPVNPCKAKKLTNMRSQGDGKGIQLNPPLKMSLERALEYIGPDEYVEATPKNLRLRKKILNETQRKRAEQSRVMKVVAE